MNNPYRQGDTLLIPVSTIPNTAKAVRVSNRVVVREGETTGHAHVLEGAAIEEFESATPTADAVERYVRLATATAYVHEDHYVAITATERAPMMIPPGSYKVIQQREFTGERSADVYD